MNTKLLRQWISRAAVGAAFALLGVSRLLAVGEIQVPLVKTTTAEFKNVKIFNRTATHLSFAYESGTAVIKLSDIDPVSLAHIERVRAGLPEPTNDAEVEMMVLAGGPLPPGKLNLAALVKMYSGKFKADSLPPGITPKMVWGFFGALAAGWLLFCTCCSLICKKTGHPGGLVVWLPVFQMIPLFRAAGMSRWWFLAMFVPLLNLVGQVLWCVKITQARGKGFLTAVMLILPVTNILAFLYLALSNGHAKEENAFELVRPPHALALN
jgi:hypothetical protein